MPINSSRVYSVPLTRQAVTGAITLIQLKAGASTPFELLRGELWQNSSTSNVQLPVQINRKSAVATVTPVTCKKHGPASDPTAAAEGTDTGVNASAEGTDGDLLKAKDMNYLLGCEFVFTPPEWIFVAAAGIIAMKLPVAPAASVTLTGALLFRELA
jgi:hypothetical protein